MTNNNPDTGTLFRAEKKSDRHPDYSGTLDFCCTHCGTVTRRRLAAWIRTARTGAKFLSLSFKPAQQATAEREQEDIRF